VEFILAKVLLPWFGGTTGVWATTMLCFQLALLAGYAYAHGIQRSSRQAWIHLAIVMVIGVYCIIRTVYGGVLPGAAMKPAPDAAPIPHIAWLFAVSIGLPFTLLASTAPLLQAWYVRIHTRDPYQLYAISNAGSLLALITYPTIVERWLPLRAQARIWTLLLFAYLIFVAACAWRAHARKVAPIARTHANIAPSTRWLWLALSACPAALFLAVTNYLTQDVAPIPLLWALPLALYLLSFIVVFSEPRAYQRGVWHVLFAMFTFLAVAALYTGTELAVGKQLAIFSVWLFTACMICHGELVRTLPEETGLTTFYLTIATGGALGGVFVALVAPLLLSGPWELHLAMVATALVACTALWRDQTSWLYRGQLWLLPACVAGVLLTPRVLKHFEVDLPAWMLAPYWPIAALVLLVLAAWIFFHTLGVPSRHIRYLNESLLGAALLAMSVFLTWHVRTLEQQAVFRSRNFYGALTVNDQELNPNLRYFELVHGRITHGNQLATKGSIRYTPTTYYNEASGAGLILRFHPQHKKGPMRVGAVGLGTGTLAAYAGLGDVFRFYEINRTVIGLAQGRPEPWFDYVPHARSLGAQVDIVPGDARLSLERELREGRPGRYDVLIVDAFNGDSIPIHLLTVEAMQIYLRHLRDEDSVIALHISNRNVDLRTVAAGLADRLQLHAIWIRSDDTENLNLQSDWVLLARSNVFMRVPEVRHAGYALLNKYNTFAPPPSPPVWTDDFSNVWQVLELKDDDGDATH
jgi:hypothetical protein